MLLDELESTQKRLKQLDKIESAIQDADKKAKNDRDFSALTSNCCNSIRLFKYAHEEIGYTLSDETLQLLSEILQKLQDTIEDGVVDENLLSATRKQINNKLNASLTKEWRDFYGKKKSSVIGKLTTIGSLAPDKDHINLIRQYITDSSEWSTLSEPVNSKTTRIVRFKTSVDEVNQIEENLNLTEEVKQFIALVTNGKAKITDLNDDIFSWIKEEKLEDKFEIKFRVI